MHENSKKTKFVPSSAYDADMFLESDSNANSISNKLAYNALLYIDHAFPELKKK